MHRFKGFFNADPGNDGFQYIEDLATAYWYSEVLFTAIDLKLFMHLDQGANTVASLTEAASCRELELYRLLRSLERLALISCSDTYWMNNPVAARYLVPGQSDYMGDFFLYRRYMQPQWSRLTEKVRPGTPGEKTPLGYSERNFLYVSAMDTLARQKAAEIVSLLKGAPVGGPVLDVGGGAGSLIRALQGVRPGIEGVVLDIDEVLDAAATLYPEESDWSGIIREVGDFRTYPVGDTFGMVIFSNFLHAYGEAEARELLLKGISSMKPGGLVLIHDYFPDRKGVSPQKGALYDLSMMLNTYNGRCHEASRIMEWLKEGGIRDITIRELATDTSIILAGGDPQLHVDKDPWFEMAIELGFEQAVAISPKEVVTAPWVQIKCSSGCGRFGKNLQCPPHTLDHGETREMLDSYTVALLVQGQPPGKSFHNKLLSLEKRMFLDGYYKAFVFGAGPCTICPECPEDGRCRHHNLARPAMEASGIDVFATAEQAGLSLSPLKNKDGYIKYIGLLLVK